MRSSVLFEPWGLGDALIAAAVLREHPARYALACHPAWIPILRSALDPSTDVRLLPIDLAYTTRSRVSRVEAGCMDELVPINDVREVLSIRGDLRDWRAARRLFPSARVRMSGWTGFIARRSTLADTPFRLGLATVRNRYEAWATLAGLSFDRISARYAVRRPADSSTSRVAIHVGAQWRSRQYPHVADLTARLENERCEITILAGREDSLPPGVAEHRVRRVMDAEFVSALREADIAVTNDSGPMHLAAFLGCRTLAMARVANIVEWVPPGVSAMTGDDVPRGYKPDPGYTTDMTLTGWPEPSLVADRILQMRKDG